MDLMQPPLMQQPAPARWLRPGAPLDVPSFIRAAISKNPTATPDSIAAELKQRRIHLPATVVAAWMQKLAAAPAEASHG